jgi:TetR/AcrR family acrAB operon transcriptional repressor
MVRKTKEEALATRGRILDAAERLFQARGVSATSLHHIAEEAGVTRGAVYWHFKDKGDLFDALLSRVVLPIEDASSVSLDRNDDTPPLQRLREHVTALFGCIAADERVQRVFEIMTTRVEFVNEMIPLRERKAASRRDYLRRLETTLAKAQSLGQINTRVPAPALALGLFALIDGLIRHWVLDPTGFDLPTQGVQAVELHLAGLTATA